MIKRQVSDALEKFGAAKKEGNIDQIDKEGKKIIDNSKEFVNSKLRKFYGDKKVNG